MQERLLLPNYFGILENDTKAKYLQSKYLKVSFAKSESLKKLWQRHDLALTNPHFSDVKPEQSLLDLKIEIADKIFHNCFFCENRCKVDREKTYGKCNTKDAKISTEFLHIGEEPVLIPSHTVFFSGCTFKCVFCQNWDISQRISGLSIKPTECANIIKTRNMQGARNVNWVGGEPTPNIPYILKVLKNLEVNTPQIWNSNMYCSKETMGLLNGVIDIYLTDFKYGNNQCANRLSKIDNYFDIISRNHKIACLDADLIIRHLVMPNHIDCCSKKILQWIKKEIPKVALNLMSQYRPEFNANRHADVNMRLTKYEYEKVMDMAKRLDLHLI